MNRESDSSIRKLTGFKHVYTLPPNYKPVCEDGRVRIFPNNLEDLEISDVIEIMVNKLIEEGSWQDTNRKQ